MRKLELQIRVTARSLYILAWFLEGFWHSNLLFTLSKKLKWPIWGSAVKLISSYLSGRSQYVTFGKKNVHLASSITSCFPGLNSWSFAVQHFWKWFVELSLWCSVSFLCRQLLNICHPSRLPEMICSMNEKLDAVSSWVRCNEMNLNTLKSQAIVIFRKDIDPDALQGIVKQAI